MADHDRLRERHIYLIQTRDQESVVGEYLGRDERGRIIVKARFDELHIPKEKVVEWTRLS